MFGDDQRTALADQLQAGVMTNARGYNKRMLAW